MASTFRFVWDGNVLLHETFKKDNSENTELTTWVFEGFVPTAKLVNGKAYSIISDHLGTPILAIDSDGMEVWNRQLDIYGRVRKEYKHSSLGDDVFPFVPFLYQGQYYDFETNLAYNRFRYYSPETGAYISQDPIKLNANNPNIYAYVEDSNWWIDVFGLAKHHTIPRRIYNPRKSKRADGSTYRPEPLVPEEVAKDKRVKGTKNSPNMWDIPDDIHKDIHNPNSEISKKNGGDYNTIFINRINQIEGDVTTEKILAIREQIAKDFEIDQYKPKKKQNDCKSK